VTVPDFRVYLVRHAKAEKEAPGGDAARALTAAGRHKFAALLQSLGDRLALSRVVTSPYKRARETAELLAHRARVPLEEDEALGSGRATGAEVLALARKAGPGAALVGHNPEMAEAMGLAGLKGHVPPGSIAAIVLDDRGGARVAWLEAPGDAH
jgi:phosphohistidine phosphatase